MFRIYIFASIHLIRTMPVVGIYCCGHMINVLKSLLPLTRAPHYLRTPEVRHTRRNTSKMCSFAFHEQLSNFNPLLEILYLEFAPVKLNAILNTFSSYTAVLRLGHGRK